MKKLKITVAGIGGVGGYFGGLLAKHFYENNGAEITFVARGEHLKQIQKNGLKVIHGSSEFIAQPALATDDPTKIGISDVIIIATKSYDLPDLIKQLKPCINKETIILPLLNGVDSRDLIQDKFPANLVLDGCVYIVARLNQNGVVENKGNIQKLFFGRDGFSSERLQQLESIFREAGIEATLSKNISTTMWEKFIFISPTATATSYFDKSIGEILADKNSVTSLGALIEEVKLLAKAKQVPVPENVTENTFNRLKSLPFETTSSMHSDYIAKKRNELKSLTYYVISEAQKYSVDTPTYLKMYSTLNTKSGKYSTLVAD